VLANCFKIDFKWFYRQTIQFSGQVFIIGEKSKSSVQQSIPTIPVETLFYIQTCADAEIKRHDRVENIIIMLVY
jgi:hypothetical protein